MKKLIIFSIIIIIIFYLIDSNVYHFLHARGKPINNLTLPDIIHDNFQRLDKKLADYYTFGLLTLFILFFLFQKNWGYLMLWLFFFVIGRFVTYIYFLATTLPDSSKSCVTSSNIFELTKNAGSCNCLNISGHFLTIIFVIFLFNHYTQNQYWFIFVALYFTGFYLVCATRNHYTVDCVSSTVVALLIITQMKRISKFINYLTHENFVKI